MNGHTTIIFNDTVVATTYRVITYERDNENQKEFRFTDKRNELTAVLFCESLDIIENANILVEKI